MSEPRREQDEVVFQLTVEFEQVVDTFTFPPYEPPPIVEPEPVDPWEEITAENMALLFAADGTWWTEEALMADPAMVAFYAWRDIMEAYLAAPTIEDKLAVVAPYQQEEFVAL